MENLYVYIENEKVNDIIKYGMKLSENANKFFDDTKKGIIAYLAPKDSQLYFDERYTCIRILTKDLNIIIYNKVVENAKLKNSFTCNIKDYTVGDYEEPIAYICSTILPENIFLYNKIRDLPMLIENSKEYYYEKFVNTMLENERFTNFELYQVLLLLGEQKKIFNVTDKMEKLKIYKDKDSGKLYTKKSNF